MTVDNFCSLLLSTLPSPPSFHPKQNSLRIRGQYVTRLSAAQWLLPFLRAHHASLGDSVLPLFTMKPAALQAFAEGVYDRLRGDILNAMEESRKASQYRDPTPAPSGIVLGDPDRAATLFPFMDMETSDRGIYDPSTGRVSPMPFDYWETVVDKKVLGSRMSRMLLARVKYDPIEEGYFRPGEFETLKLNEVNLYYHPLWRREKVKPSFPPLLKEFFRHLFPTLEVRQFIYSWMAHMLKSRAQTYLYMPGHKGVGKTTFAYLCAVLVGREHYEMGKSDFAESRFNSFIWRRRLIVLDEYNCWTTSEKETLKRVINDKLQVEAKGVDQKTIDNHCSFIICNNNHDSVSLDPDDRRFSVPEMTEGKLEKSVSKADIKRLLAEIKKCDRGESSEMIAQFGHWLLKNYPIEDYPAEYAWQRTHFERSVIASAREGTKFVLEQMQSKKKAFYLYSDLRTAYKVQSGAKNIHFPRPATLRDYFEALRLGGKRLAEVEGEGLSMRFIPAKEYRPEVKEGDDVDFE